MSRKTKPGHTFISHTHAHTHWHAHMDTDGISCCSGFWIFFLCSNGSTINHINQHQSLCGLLRAHTHRPDTAKPLTYIPEKNYSNLYSYNSNHTAHLTTDLWLHSAFKKSGSNKSRGQFSQWGSVKCSLTEHNNRCFWNSSVLSSHEQKRSNAKLGS